jgi:hypothetical protein
MDQLLSTSASRLLVIIVGFVNRVLVSYVNWQKNVLLGSTVQTVRGSIGDNFSDEKQGESK